MDSDVFKNWVCVLWFMMRQVHFHVVNNKVVLHKVKDVQALTYTIQLKDSWIMQKS